MQLNDYKSIDEILDKITDNKGLTFPDIGQNDNDYKDFKARYKFFKEWLAKEMHNFSEKEIIKINKHYYEFTKLYNWNGFDRFLTILEWENGTTDI